MYIINRSLFPPLQLREQMLSKMTSVLSGSPSNSSLEVFVTAKAVAGLTRVCDELSPSAQVQLTLTLTLTQVQLTLTLTLTLTQEQLTLTLTLLVEGTYC